MTAEMWEMYTQQAQSSGAADLPERLPQNVQALLEGLGLDALDPSAYTELGFGQTAQKFQAVQLRKLQIHYQYIRLKLGYQSKCFYAVTGGAQYIKLFLV